MRLRFLWLLVIPFLCGPGCEKAPPESPTEVVAVYAEVLPSEPGDPFWSGAPVHNASLITQDMVEPRLIDPSTRQVRVQAANDGSRMAFRLEWDDATVNDLPGTSRFSDACAIQIPAEKRPDVPAPQMGEDGKQVEITYWSASWQAVVDGRKDSIKEIYPGATVDHYPFQAPSLEEGSPQQESLAKLYAPARGLGNPMGGSRESPVQDLIAEGPGTLARAESSVSEGSGLRLENGWAVVLSRPLPKDVMLGERSQIAFGIWEGSNEEVGARKMRSVWIPLFLKERNE